MPINGRYAIYTRTNQADAWKFETSSQYLTSALLAQGVNEGFGVETLIVPTAGFKALPVYLCSTQTQTDLKEAL